MSILAVHRILHISDLHFDEENNCLLKKEKYKNDFIDSIKNISDLDTVIISGDIVDKGGSERVYREAGNFLEFMKENTGIRNILCVPGNHDVSRKLLMGIEGDENTDKENLWKYYDEKLKYYWDFMSKNKLSIFHKSGIVSYLQLNNPDIIIIGLDSTDRIGKEDCYGFVNVEELKNNLEEIFDNKYQNYIKIAVMHHRPVIYESRSQSVSDNNGTEVGQYGTFDSDNWDMVKKLLLQYDFHFVLTGHVHGSQSGQFSSYDSSDDTITYSTVGSIGVDFSIELKKCIDAEKNKDIIKNLDELKCYGSIYGNHNSYNILTFSDNGEIKEEQYKYIIDEGIRRWLSFSDKLLRQPQIEDKGVFDFGDETYKIESGSNEVVNYEDKILDYVAKNGLYKTGHYHWKNNARLNWIDTSYFFQQTEAMYEITAGINDIYLNNNLLNNPDWIIGLGIKGAILLSYVRFLFIEKKCSYLPENKKEYNKYEMTLFDKCDDVKNIVLLTDVVHTGKTVKDFAEEIFKKINHHFILNVITIFDATPGNHIANINDKVTINLFSLAKIKVIECQGGGDNCVVFNRKLANVIEYREDRE